MQYYKTYKSAHVWYVFVLLVFMLFVRLSAAPIYILDEAKNAQCAREMLNRGDWVVPTFNGKLRTDKPVLHYYFMMAAYKIMGVNEFAARFFSAVMGMLTVLVTYVFAKRFIDPVGAFLSAIVLVASTHFLFEFRMSVPDPYLIFFASAGLFTAFTYLQSGKSKFLYLAALCFGLAALAKGPVALALPGLCLLAWVIWKRKWKLLFNWKLVPAITIAAAVVLPWYIAVHKATLGEWTRGFFIEHNIDRFSSPQEGHGGFFLITLLFALLGLLPFSANAGEIIKRRKEVFSNELVQFSAIVVMVFIVFFSISSTRLPNYAMPCYPFAGIIIGVFLQQVIERYHIKKYPFIIVLVIGAVIPIAGYFALRQESQTVEISWVAFLLLIPFMGMILILTNWRRLGSYQKVMSLFVVYAVFNTLALHLVYPIIYSQNPVIKTLPLVKAHEAVYSYEIYNPGFNFYLKDYIQIFTSIDTLKTALVQNPHAILITRTQFADSLQKLPLVIKAQQHDLFEYPTTIIYAVKE